MIKNLIISFRDGSLGIKIKSLVLTSEIMRAQVVEIDIVRDSRPCGVSVMIDSEGYYDLHLKVSPADVYAVAVSIIDWLKVACRTAGEWSDSFGVTAIRDGGVFHYKSLPDAFCRL